MPDTKITALTAIGANPIIPATFPIPMVDLTDTSMAASGTTKKVTVNQILGAGGTATLASATITGDLTVSTNTLKTTSGNVGIGTVTPDIFSRFYTRTIGFNSSGSTVMQINGSSYSGIDLGAGGTRTFGIASSATDASLTTLTNIPIVFGINNSTAMTLNSTGLGVGNAPVAALDVYKVANDTINRTNATFCFGQIAGLGAALLGQQSASAPYQFNLQAANAANSVQFPLVLQPSGGQVGIGVAPSALWNAAFKAIQIGSSNYFSIAAQNSAASRGSLLWNAIGSGDEAFVYRSTGDAANRFMVGGGSFAWYTAAAGTAGNAITDFATAKMTLDASGRLLVGVTSALASGNTFQNLGSARQVLTLKGDDQTSYTLGVWSASAIGDNLFQYFATETTLTVRGGISYNRGGGLVAYNTTSDYRAKDIIGPVSNSGSLIDSLKVYVGKMKGATIERPMLIAHEAQEVAPYAVTGTKDEVDADGKPKYQQMDASALVPLLIAEIQSLRARVQTLEAK